MSDSLRPHGLCSPWNSLGQNTGVGSRSLLQGIFPTQGSNPGLPHCRWLLYQLSHQGMPLKQIIKLRYRSNLPKITLLKVGGLRIEAQVRWTIKRMFFHCFLKRFISCVTTLSKTLAQQHSKLFNSVNSTLVVILLPPFNNKEAEVHRG